MNSLMDSKKIKLVLILEQQVYGEMLKMHILIWESRILILTHRKICLLKKFFPNTSKKRKGIIAGGNECWTCNLTPLVISVTGGESTETSTFQRHFASKIALKKDERYEDVVNLISCKLSFLILRSALTCIRGCRPYDKDFVMNDDFSLTCNSMSRSNLISSRRSNFIRKYIFLLKMI